MFHQSLPPEVPHGGQSPAHHHHGPELPQPVRRQLGLHQPHLPDGGGPPAGQLDTAPPPLTTPGTLHTRRTLLLLPTCFLATVKTVFN